MLITLDNLRQTLQAVKNKLDGITSRVSTVESSVNTMSSNMVNSVNGQTGAVTGIATASDVDALEARVDNIVAPQGDPSLTEVSDARVGVDGTTYSTLKGRIDEEVDELNERLDEITNEHIPTNHAVMSSDTLIKKADTMSVTYNSDGSVNFQYPYDLGNPIVIYGLTGIITGKTYNFSIKLVSGSLTKIQVEQVNPSTGSQIASLGTATKDGDIYSLTFTPSAIPSGNTIGISFYFARTLSRDITFTDFSCIESGDNPYTYIDNDALKDIPEDSLSYELQQKIDNIHVGNSAEVSFIGGNVYTSECTLIKFADGTSLVVDTGTGNRDLIYSEMNRLGITHIDYLFISHYHPDHAANTVYFGNAGLFDSNTTFILPMYITEDMYTRIPENPPYWTIYQPEVLQTAETYNCTIYRPTTDWEKITVGGASLEFLNVDHSDWFEMASTDYNDCSLCAYLTIGNTSIFFSGDIGLPVMNKYKKNMRHCTIFKANHHAEGYNAVPVFLGSISPEIVVTMQGTRMITKTGTPSIDDQFYYKSTGLQSWCERYHIYNYLTSFNDNAPIGIKMNEAGYCFETKSRASNRFEEGIYAADDPDVPNKNVNCFALS